MPLDQMTGLVVDAGYLLVVRPEVLAVKYAPRYALRRPHYALPRLDLPWHLQRIQYRGLDRDAIEGNPDGSNLAELYLDELERAGRAAAGFLFSAEEASTAQGYLQSADHELVWARVRGAVAEPPAGSKLLGFESTFFLSDHFSPSCDCMLFPRWHGTDEDGTLFTGHYNMLNENGLFDTAEAAECFLTFYLSLDWTERGEFVTAEVFLPRAS